MTKIKFLWLPVLLAAFIMPMQASAALTGSGLELDPYIWDECSDFGDSTDASAYYELTANLDCGGAVITPMFTGSTFSGEIEGGDFTISNIDIVIADEGDYATNGLFVEIDGATIQNMNVDDLTITVPDGDQSTGLIAGRAHGTNLIDNVNVTNGVVNSGGRYIVGGLIGDIDDSTGITTVSSSSYEGSITVNPTSGTIQDIGGLFGTAGSVILTDSFADVIIVLDGQVDATGVGGIAGSCGDCQFTNVYSTGNIGNGPDLTVIRSLGGLIGYSSNLTMVGSYSDINIILVPFDTDFVEAQDVGGLIGETAGSTDILQSYFNGEITLSPTTTGEGIGGLVGKLDVESSSTIDQVYTNVEITTENITVVGGLIGFVGINGGDIAITNSFTTGQIYMDGGDYLAGFIAIASDDVGTPGEWLTIENAYSIVELDLVNADLGEVVSGFMVSLFSTDADTITSTISNVFTASPFSSDYGMGAAMFSATNGGLTLTDAYYDKSAVDQLLDIEAQFDFDCTIAGSLTGCTAVNPHFDQPTIFFSPDDAPLDNFDTDTIWDLSPSYQDGDENDVYTYYPSLANLFDPYFPRPTIALDLLLEDEEVNGQEVTTNQPTFSFSVDGPELYDGFGYGIIIGSDNNFGADSFDVVYGDYEFAEGVNDFSFTVGDPDVVAGEELLRGYTEPEGEGSWGEEGMELENGDYYLYVVAFGGIDEEDPVLSSYYAPTGDGVAFTVNTTATASGGSSTGSSRLVTKSTTNDSNDDGELSDYEVLVQRVEDEGLVEKELEKGSDKCEALMIMARALGWEYDEAVVDDGFSDTPDWCKPVAKYAKDMGYVEGRSEGVFGLDTPLNRFEFVQILFRVLGGEAGSDTAPYSDTIMEWAAEAVNWAYEKGHMTGFADGTFGGEKGIIKQDIGVVMLRITD